MKNRTFQTPFIALLGAATLAVSGAAFAGEDGDMKSDMKSGNSSMSHDQMTASLMVEDQKVDDKSVVIDSVTMAQDGFVVIHASTAEGKLKAPEAIGHTMVEKGVHEDVSVTLNQSVKSGDKLFAMLHQDTGTAGEYEFAESGAKLDGAMKADGKPVIKSFMVK